MNCLLWVSRALTTRYSHTLHSANLLGAYTYSMYIGLSFIWIGKEAKSPHGGPMYLLRTYTPLGKGRWANIVCLRLRTICAARLLLELESPTYHHGGRSLGGLWSIIIKPCMYPRVPLNIATYSIEHHDRRRPETCSWSTTAQQTCPVWQVCKHPQLSMRAWIMAEPTFVASSNRDSKKPAVCINRCL